MRSSWLSWRGCWRPGRWPPGETDQRWTLARVRDLVDGKFGVQYTVPGIWYLLRRRGWSAQMGARRAIERDDGAIEVWKKEIWPQVKGRRRL